MLLRQAAMMLLLGGVTAVTAACATTATSGACITCDSATFGSNCDRFVREDVENFAWSEFAICMGGFALVVQALSFTAYGYHFLLSSPKAATSAGPAPPPPPSSARRGDDSSAAPEKKPSAESTGVTDHEEASRTTVVNVADEAPGEGSQRASQPVNENGRSATSESDPQHVARHHDEPQASHGSATPTPPPSSSKAENGTASQQPQKPQDTTGAPPASRTAAASNARPSSARRTVSPSRSRVYGAMHAGTFGTLASSDECPSTALPAANASTARGASRSPRRGSVASVNHHIPVIAPPSASATRARSTRQLPPTENPVAQAEAGREERSSATGARGLSMATDLGYFRSTSMAMPTPGPAYAAMPSYGRSASAIDPHFFSPRPLTLGAGGNGGGGAGGASLITLDCARPAQLQIDEGDGTNLRFNVRFLDGTPFGSSVAPQSVAAPQHHVVAAAPSQPGVAAAEPLPTAAMATPRHQQQREPTPASVPQDQGEKHQQQQRPSQATPRRAPAQPDDQRDSAAFASQQPTLTTAPPQPKFRKGDVIRRNANDQNVECDFGGFVGNMLCGEVACVQSVDRYQVAPGRTFFSYQVVGGDRAPMVEMENLFTRVGEDPQMTSL